MNTILYMKDIAEKHPYIDYNTKNQSFLRIALVLKRMGIHNYYFFLSLYDRTLLGVDPRSPNLTTEQMLRISQECKINIWYFLREVVRVPVIGQEDGTGSTTSDRKNYRHAVHHRSRHVRSLFLP